MKLSNNIFDIIILLGAIQGFTISALLYFRKEKVLANRLLAILILLISLACLNIYLLEAVQFTSTFARVMRELIPLVIIMPTGPLIFFYVTSLLNSEFKLDESQRLHFYPLILDFVPSIVVLLYIIGYLAGLFNNTHQPILANFIGAYNKYVDIPRWISVSVYVGMAWMVLIQPHKSKQASTQVSWPKQLLYGFTFFQIIWLLHLVPYIIPSLSDALLNSVGWYPIYIPMAVMVYWLGINGNMINRQEKLKQAKPSILGHEIIESTTRILETAMQQDLIFLNPNLSLNEVVKHTAIPQKIISAVLNQHLGTSFNEFVNQYRVEAVKVRLLQPGNKHLTITGIAFECGFNSQATFQRTFKQFTGLSPSEFLAQQTLKTT